MPESEPYVNTAKEKLLCLMVLHDDIAQQMFPGVEPAFWRGFIVQNRETGKVFAKMRFKYPDHTNWAEIVPKEQNDNPVKTMEYLRARMVLTFTVVTGILGGDAAHAIQCFFPPDDGGDGCKTLIWLEMQDLVEITEVKEIT